ncbi:hypothetical protein Tco_0081341 [Tanacetum coccineum]
MSGKFTKHADGLKQKNITSSPSSSPRRCSGGDVANGKDERKRAFSNLMKNMCWKKAKIVQGYDYSRWRKYAVGNVVCNGHSNCQGCRLSLL